MKKAPIGYLPTKHRHPQGDPDNGKQGAIIALATVIVGYVCLRLWLQ